MRKASGIRAPGNRLLRLVRQFVELGGDPRQVINRRLQLFEIDEAATLRAVDGVPRYKPTHSYAEICATLRRLTAERARS